MEVNETYFKSYEDVSIHELMLKDGPRMEAYYKALEANAHELKGKVVLDVGCGTGVLSMFAAKHGAAKVYAIEASGVADIAETLIKDNGFENVITIINSMVEEVELPEKVDLIISEWMGFYLLHESMLESVLYARDHFLKEGGYLFPRYCTIYVSPVSMTELFEEKGSFYSDIYGLNFISMVPHLMAQQPKITHVKAEQLLAEAQIMKKIDCMTITIEELQMITRRFFFTTNVDGVFHGFCIWFDVSFEKMSNPKVDDETNIASVLSTTPGTPKTHWKQTVILLPGTGFEIVKDTPINCRITMVVDEFNTRRYNLTVSMSDDDDEEQDMEEEDPFDGHPQDCDCDRCKVIRACMQLGEQENETETK